MGRIKRIDEPGLVYHITSRGARQLPLYQDDQDRIMCLRFLGEVRAELPFLVHSLSLMGNHFHFLLQTLQHTLAQIMQKFKRRYAVWLNFKYSRFGHAFQGPFHSIPVQNDEYFKTVARYIHLNSVRAGIVQRPEQYLWSDYGDILAGRRNEISDPRFLLNYFGTEPQQQIEGYRRFVEDGMQRPEPISEEALYRLRSWGSPPTAGELWKPGISS